MAVRVLTDFHHSSLLRATNMLFQDRLGFSVFRPIGMEWFTDGFWAINDQEDTARQFLGLEQGYRPPDGTPALNMISKPEAMNNSFIQSGAATPDGLYFVEDPGKESFHKACTLEFFKQHDFQYVIASIPAHVPLFERLIAEFMPNAKLIIQVGNNWDLSQYEGKNVLASTAPHFAPGVNAHFYHQEFDTDIFKPRIAEPTKKIYSFVNILQNTGQGWDDFHGIEKIMPDFHFASFGGQCRDGNVDGPRAMANKMHEAEFVFHSKPGGDGFGHVIHNAFACGRPVIARPSQYKDQLAAQLFVPGCFVNLDAGREKAAAEIRRLTNEPDELFKMGRAAGEIFKAVVNYDQEAEDVGTWLNKL